MNLKKILAGLFSVCLALSPMSICAEETSVVAQNADGTQTYADYTSAWSAANSGTEIIMLQDWNLSDRLIVNEGATVTIDMNGCKIDRGLSNTKMDGEVIYMKKNSSLALNGSTDHEFIVRMLNVDEDGNTKTNVTIGGLVTGGASQNGGGGIHMKGNCKLTLDHVGVMGNLTKYFSASGGGIFTDGDDCEVNLNNGTKISYNNAQRNGGGIYVNNEDTYINMNNSEISQNYSSDGGAIYSDDDATRISLENHSLITKNKAFTHGGGVVFNDSYGLLQSKDSTGVISYNTVESKTGSSGGGGAFFASSISSDDEGEVKNITFDHNSASATGEKYTSEGGALCVRLNQFKITNCTFTNNEAQKGGAIFVDGKNLHMSDSKIEENEASKNGGAVYVDSQYDLYLEGNLSIQNNTRTSDSTKNDIYLEDGTFTTAYVSGTPSNGSSVGLLGDGEIKVGINQSENNGSFFCDADNYHLEWSGSDIKQKSGATGSVFGNGNTLIALCVMVGIGVVGAVVLVVNKKKKSA